MMATLYALQVEKCGVTCRVRVNDVPIFGSGDRSGQEREATDLINGWTRASNQLQIDLAWPDPEPFAPGVALVAVSVHAFSPEQTMREGRVIVSWRWPTEHGDREQDYPLRAAVDFSTGDPPPSELWPRTRPLMLDPGTRLAVLGLAQDLSGALGRRDFDRVDALLAFKAVDVARCHHFSVNEAAAQQRAFFEMVLADPGATMRPIDDTMELHAVGDARLIWLTRPSFAPAIASDVERGPRLELPLYLAMVDGSWTIVR